MTSLHALDARLLDARLATSGTSGGPASSLRPRYNSQIMTRFMKSSEPETLAAIADVGEKEPVLYSPYWDADLQSYMFLQEFVQANPDWIKHLLDVSLNYGMRSQEMDPERLGREVRGMLDLAPEREERFMEIIDQDDAEGALSYWAGMLQISAARHPATFLMLRVGRRVGEHVVMCLKGEFRSPRPSQLSPAIVPMIDPPVTPSFPAGHAVQAYLMSHLLADSFKRIPQQELPENLDEASGPLFRLAHRVSENRIVAGVHFPTDIAAGKAVGIACFKKLQNLPGIQELQKAMRRELRQYA
jgi:hypothetical protein